MTANSLGCWRNVPNIRMMVDSNIMDRCLAGDQQAFGRFYTSTAPYVYAIVKNYFTDQNEIRDVMQEIFAQIFLSLKNYDPQKGQLKNWLSRLTVHQCINCLKASQKLRSVMLVEKYEDDNTTDMSYNNLACEDLNKLLAGMPVGYRTIFLLSVIEEYTHKEIAGILEISQETSRSQLSRAIKWIKNNILEDSKTLKYG